MKEIIIFSLFSALFLMDVLNISLKIRKLLKLNLLKQYTILKPLDCLPCFSFQIALITSVISKGSIKEIVLASMATYLAAYIIEIIRNK